MQQWNIKSRAHECARTGRAFTEKEVFHTAIYFDKASGEFQRRDIALDAWNEEIAERTPFSSWKSEYQPPGGEAKGKIEIASRESAENLMRRLIEEGEPETENARYILALMLERKKILVPKQVEHTEEGKIVLYENRKTGEETCGRLFLVDLAGSERPKTSAVNSHHLLRESQQVNKYVFCSNVHHL
jgi:hypothetical protein